MKNKILCLFFIISNLIFCSNEKMKFEIEKNEKNYITIQVKSREKKNSLPEEKLKEVEKKLEESKKSEEKEKKDTLKNKLEKNKEKLKREDIGDTIL